MAEEQRIPVNLDGRGDGEIEREVNAASVYPRIPLPTLIEGAVDAYFMSMEFWFAASGVTNDTRKFNTVLAQVPPTKLLELAAIITAAPANEKYAYIKQALTRHFADSQTRRLQRVLSEMPLGDLRPSQLYHNMARMAGTALGESALIDLWASRLPQITQAAVVAATGAVAERLSTADRVHESLGLRQNQVAQVAPAVPVAPAAPAAPDFERLIQRIEEQFRRFEARLPNGRDSRDSSRGNSRDSSHGRNRSRTRSHQRGESANIPELCWYHDVFGQHAQKCREPCNWSRASASNQSTPEPSTSNNGTH